MAGKTSRKDGQERRAGKASRKDERENGEARMFGLLGSQSRRTIDTTKDTQFSDSWLWLAILLTLAAMALNNRFLTAAAAIILAMIAISWSWSALSFRGLSYRRRFSEIRAFRGEKVELRLEVRNGKWLPLTWLNIVDQFPAGLSITDKDLVTDPGTNRAELRTFWMPGPFQRLIRRFHIDCTERGFYRYGPAHLHSGDGFGFFGRRGVLSHQDQLIVYPTIYSVAELRLPTRNPFGESRSRGRLYEDPLRTVGIREWQPADSLRRVHWKASARHQELLSRQYEPSEEQQLLLFLNVATLERHWHGHIPELQERVISVAGSLAALAVEERLPVGLIANGALPSSDQSLRLLPGRSPAQLVRILELLAAVTPFATQPIEEMVLQEATRAPWGATLVIVTAIAHDDLLATILDLVTAGRRCVLFTLAEEPPTQLLPNVTVYHLPHLVDDLIVPQLIQT
ncbi:MAG: DUF58 domain-containing protein [Chloroflexota bacterium]